MSGTKAESSKSTESASTDSVPRCTFVAMHDYKRKYACPEDHGPSMELILNNIHGVLILHAARPWYPFMPETPEPERLKAEDARVQQPDQDATAEHQG